MNIIAVDDEALALESLKRAIQAATAGAEIVGFLSAGDALSYACENQVDVAFLDIQMREMHGLLLAQKLKELYVDTNIIFVTAFSGFMRPAFELHASGYVMKPIDPAQVEKELAELRAPVKHLVHRGVRVTCFGSFSVYVDGRAVVFRRPKAKELLAYLVDRKGASVGKKELAAILWEDEPYTRSKQVHLHKLLEEIDRAIKEAGGKTIIIRSRGAYGVDLARFTCDYYEYQNGNARAVNEYRGEYMTDYSWGEFTAGFLNRHF